MDFDLEAHVRHRAYEIWECEGRPHGRSHEHWEQAMCEINASLAAPVAPKVMAVVEAPRPAEKPKTRSAKSKAPVKPPRQSARARQATLN
jgi:hypothetical protein